jgi:4-hydroxybenzoate polyprenyltransferase
MISRSALLHVRLPFSWFLLPVFMLALTIVPDVNWYRAAVVFVVLHFFLYAASNGFNSYYDRDEGSIGGLRNPPPVTRDLLWFSLALDGVGLLLALLMGWDFFLWCLVYGTASKIYSWNVTRLKKHGIASWLFVGTGQGSFIFLLTVTTVAEFPTSGLWSMNGCLLPAIAAGFFLLGIFPLTQIYQHAEDARRNDMTLSRMLGIEKTFYCAGAYMGGAVCGFFYYFYKHSGMAAACLFAAMLGPAIYFFIRWFLACRKDPLNADFKRTMRMNLLASSGVNLFGVIMLLIMR